MRKNNGRKGFTLIELMIVIAIIIILAAIAIPNYLRMTERARGQELQVILLPWQLHWKHIRLTGESTLFLLLLWNLVRM